MQQSDLSRSSSVLRVRPEHLRRGTAVAYSTVSYFARSQAMEQGLLSLFADPRLSEIAICVGVIWVLRWIDLMK
jgi:hypothetical protein